MVHAEGRAPGMTKKNKKCIETKTNQPTHLILSREPLYHERVLLQLRVVGGEAPQPGGGGGGGRGRLAGGGGQEAAEEDPGGGGGGADNGGGHRAAAAADAPGGGKRISSCL